MEQTRDDQKPSLLSNILAIIGFIILIIIIIWGLVHLASLSKGWFSSSPTSSALTVTVPKAVTAGTVTTISWQNPSTAAGSYSFVFQCQNGVQVLSPVNGAMSQVACGTAFPLPASAKSVQVVPLLAGSNSATIPFTIIFAPASGGANAEGSGSLAVNPNPMAALQNATSTPGVSVATSSAPHYTKPDKNTAPPRLATPADLSVRILAVGTIDPATGQFVDRYPTMPNDIGAVEFDIANVGGTPTGTWYFTAQLPITGGFPYSSNPQISLAPGSHIVNTLKFTQVNPAGGTFSVQVNPNGIVKESSYANNVASAYVY